MSILFRSRRVLACLPAIALAAIAIHETMQPDLKIIPKYDDSSVEVALIAPEELSPPEPEPVVEAPPQPPVEALPPIEEEIAEAPVVEPPPRPIPKPKAVVSKPKPVPKPQPQARPEPQVAKASPPATRPATPTSPPVVASPAVAPSRPPADLESRYVARLLAELEKYKQYPRGREASLQRPEGNVVVWLLVDRSGKVLDSGIEKKASNMLLNRAAQTSLRRLDQVVPFPENSFSGKDKYRFTATLVYNME